VPADIEFFDQIVSATGIEIDVDRIDEKVVADNLDWAYGLTGALSRIDTEKDDTFLLDTGTRRYLVKVAPHAEDPAVVNLQSAAMLHLERETPYLPAQRLIPGLDGQVETFIRDEHGRPRILRVMSYLEGSLLRDVPASEAQMRSVGVMMARTDAALSGFRHANDERLLLWNLKLFPHMRRLVEYTDDPVHRGLAHHVFDRFDQCVTPVADQLESQCIHGDFSPFNVLVDPDSPEFVTGIIDFGDVMYSPVLFELAVAVANQLGLDESDPWSSAVQIVHGYRNVRPLSAETTELLAVAGPARLLLRALVYGWRAVVDPRSREYGLLHSAKDWQRLQLALSVDERDVRERLAASEVPHVL
jgi:hydroxylysine kinase